VHGRDEGFVSYSVNFFLVLSRSSSPSRLSSRRRHSVLFPLFSR
jgi:hypothetical protein